MDNDLHSLESQILKISCILFAIATVFGTVMNIILNLGQVIILFTTALAIISLASLFVLVKYHKYKLIRFVTTLLLFSGINLSWVTNYQSFGPILILFTLLVVFVVFVWPHKMAILLNAVFILNIFVLYLIDMRFKGSFPAYSSENTRLSDVYFGTVVAVIILFIFSYKAKLLYQKKYRDARKSDELKSAFLATMSHELRTPLNAIIGFTDLISDELDKKEILEYTKIVNNSGKHLLSIIEDLFDLSFLETNQVNVSKEVFNLNDLLKNLHTVAIVERNKAGKNHIGIELKLPEHLEVDKINSDPLKIKQILHNLLRNAIKFTHEGTIRFGYDISKVKRKWQVRFFVEDTGIGIDKENYDLIFERFNQVETSHTRSYDGIGIGLTIARKLVTALNGTISLESELNKGSVFCFNIPVKKKDLLARQIMEEKAKPFDKPVNVNQTILIVEDDILSFEYLNILMESKGFKPVHARNGEEAVEVCRDNNAISLVLMDINLPKMSGLEATKRIREFRPGLPIIAQTAHAVSGDREKYLQAGFNEYTSKPILKNELFEKMDKLINIR